MSTLKVDTIQDQTASNSSTPAEIYEGRAKAWVNFNGTGTVEIRDSYNVSSITDVSAGHYVINFSSSFSNANYCAVGMCGDDTTGPGGYGTRGAPDLAFERASDNFAAGAVKVNSAYGASASSNGTSDIDYPVICVACFGN
jgi:hypothetical protein